MDRRGRRQAVVRAPVGRGLRLVRVLSAEVHSVKECRARTSSSPTHRYERTVQGMLRYEQLLAEMPVCRKRSVESRVEVLLA
jgi:hypothetical protein